MRHRSSLRLTPDSRKAQRRTQSTQRKIRIILGAMARNFLGLAPKACRML
jgi:hypothetical protein